MTAAEQIAAIRASLDELEKAIAALDHSADLEEINARVKRITASLSTPTGAISSETGSLGVAKG